MIIYNFHFFIYQDFCKIIFIYLFIIIKYFIICKVTIYFIINDIFVFMQYFCF